MPRLLLAGVALTTLVVGGASAQFTSHDLHKVSGREYVRLCMLNVNARPCLELIYASATVNRLLDAIKNQKTFCPPVSKPFPPDDIVAGVAAWSRSHPASLEMPSDEALSAALVAMYPCG
jgi:Ssp1 endopeptidase immunity protein Rap1a